MERYEAILEQLKKAQGRGLETVTNRLDFVVQSLEELIQEAKSSVQGALPQSADEYLPVDEVVAALDGFREEAEAERRRANELVARITELEAAHVPTTREGLPLAELRSLDSARSQSELLRELLPVLSEHVARAVVLVLREGAVSAWSGIGFADGELLREWKGRSQDSPVLLAMEEASAPVAFGIGDDPLFERWMNDEPRPEEAMLVPVVLRGRTMGGIYVDRLAGQPWKPDAAQTLVALVCLLIDTLPFRSGPAAMLAEPVEIGAVAGGAVFEPVEPAEPTEGALPETEAEGGEAGVDPSATVRIEAVAPEVVEAPSAAAAFAEDEVSTDEDVVSGDVEVEAPAAEIEIEPGEPSEEAAVDEEFVRPEVEPEEPQEMPTEVAAPAPPPAAEAEGATTEGAATPGFLDEPPPVKPIQPPPVEPETAVSEDQALNEEAQRFARLLVSEIKLYNEEQVDRGREAHDIYRRLKEDIDRSREMFEKRISADVRAKKDYFRDELVRILADGDPDLLGM